MLPAIEYQGQLQPQDWLKANALHNGRVPWYSPRKLPLLVAAAAVGSAIGLAHGAVLILLLIFAASIVTYRYSLRQRGRGRFAQLKSLQVPFHSRFDEHGFRTTSAVFDDRRSWTDFVGWTENEEYFLLYEADDILRIIPKRLMGGDAAVHQLQELFTSHLGAPV